MILHNASYGSENQQIIKRNRNPPSGWGIGFTCYANFKDDVCSAGIGWMEMAAKNQYPTGSVGYTVTDATGSCPMAST